MEGDVAADGWAARWWHEVPPSHVLDFPALDFEAEVGAFPLTWRGDSERARDENIGPDIFDQKVVDGQPGGLSHQHHAEAVGDRSVPHEGAHSPPDGLEYHLVSNLGGRPELHVFEKG
jgi:hypothetical protein